MSQSGPCKMYCNACSIILASGSRGAQLTRPKATLRGCVLCLNWPGNTGNIHTPRPEECGFHMRPEKTLKFRRNHGDFLMASAGASVHGLKHLAESKNLMLKFMKCRWSAGQSFYNAYSNASRDLLRTLSGTRWHPAIFFRSDPPEKRI